MKVMYITAGNIPSKWAHSIQVVKMAQAFQQIGHEVELVSACFLRDWRKDISPRVWAQYGVSTPFKFTRLPLSWLVQKENSFNLGRFSYGYYTAFMAKQKRVDLVFARNYLAPYWSARMNIPTIAETHAEPSDFYQKQKLYEATKLKSFKALVTISDKLAEAYARVGVPEKKIIVEQDGVDLALFAKVNHDKMQTLRQKLLSNKQGIVLYAGHLYDYKGIPTLLKAAQFTPEVQFVLVGGWEKDIKRVRQKASSMELKNVVLTGFIENAYIPEYLKTADVLVLPYTNKHEQAATTSPLKLFEYMAAKRPIVATGISNVVSVLKDGYNGVIIEPDNAEALSAAIQKVLKNPAYFTKLALQAQRDVEFYSWDKRVERILAFYKREDFLDNRS